MKALCTFLVALLSLLAPMHAVAGGFLEKRIIARAVQRTPDVVYSFAHTRLFPTQPDLALAFNRTLATSVKREQNDAQILQNLADTVSRFGGRRQVGQGRRAVERAEQIAELVETKPRHFLDIGAGSGKISRQLRKIWKPKTALGLDVYRPRSQGIPVKVYDGKTMPLENKRFDAATLLMVLHHATNPTRILAETSRVMKKGGRLIMRESDIRNGRQRETAYALDLLQFPAFSEPLDGAPPVNLHSREQWERAAREAGFVPIRTTSTEKETPFRSFYAVFEKRTDPR